MPRRGSRIRLAETVRAASSTARERVEAQPGESLALPGAEIGLRLPHILPVEFVGDSPPVGRPGDEDAGMSGEGVDIPPNRGQVDA
jgi:hypothetical protein